MSDSSKIEWTEASWNPVRGCTPISSGCSRCYALVFAERFRGVPGHPYERGFDLRLVPEMLDLPLRWTRPRKIFVNSMSDLFHEGIPDEYIHRVAAVMVKARHHTFQVLTKRAERMSAMLRGALHEAAAAKHILWGVSVENRQHGLPRIDYLRASGAVNLFLSIEPLLEDLGRVDLTRISWVIVGGESGPRARPIDAQWVRSLRGQAVDARVAFFFKQWGGVRKKETGRTLDGRTWDEIPVL